MGLKSWIETRSSRTWAAVGAAAIVLGSVAAYAGGVGAGPDIGGLEVVRLQDGHVRLRFHGVGVGSTRAEVDASPLAASVHYRVTRGRYARFPGEPEAGTEASVALEYDENDRVKRLGFGYEGNWLSAERVLQRYRRLFRRLGGRCDRGGCYLPASDGEAGGLAGSFSRIELGAVGVTVAR